MKRKSYDNSWAGRAQKFARTSYKVARAVAPLYKTYRGYTNTKGSVRHAPGPITGESDYRSVYKRKPFPRGRKKRWIKFTRRVKAVAEKLVAPQQMVCRRNATIVSAIATQATTSLFTVLGSFGGNDETDDLRQMYENVFNLAGTTGTVGTTLLVNSMRVHITGWLAEIMIANNASNVTYIDCYYWRCKRDVPNAYNNLGDIFTGGFTDMAQTTVGASTSAPQKMDINDYGVTPFQCHLFSRCFQVYKKTRVKLAAGGTCQLELRSGKNYYRSASFDRNYTFLKNCSEGIFFVQYGSPGATAPVTSTTNVQYSMNVNYIYRRMSDDRMTGVVGDD